MIKTTLVPDEKERDITMLVTCERCSSKLETALSKDSTKYDFTLHVAPRSVCERELVQEAAPSIQSVRLVLNDSERESLSIV